MFAAEDARHFATETYAHYDDVTQLFTHNMEALKRNWGHLHNDVEGEVHEKVCNGDREEERREVRWLHHYSVQRPVQQQQQQCAHVVVTSQYLWQLTVTS